MTKNILLLAVIVLAVAAYTVFSENIVPKQAQPQSENPSVSARMPAPDFAFHDVKGKERKIEDFRGRAVVLNFWASWCAPCIVEFPQMIRLAETEKDTAFLFLGVGETPEAARAFIKRHLPADLPDNVVIGLDTDKSISQDGFKTYKLPETYFITPSLTIADKIIGNSVDWEGEDIRLKIRALSKE